MNYTAVTNITFAQAEPTKNSNRFIIGTFENGITVYKQQMRALNLLFSIKETNRVDEGGKIAIIGGGISGITAAAAALILGYKVYLFERSPSLCHLQLGCDTRWIHPHIYNWPSHGSERLYAGLPFLNWRAGTASEVIEQLISAFNKIVQEKEGNIQIHKGVSLSIRSDEMLIIWDNSDLTSEISGELKPDAIIFAVGFGVEQGLTDSSPSYWRNDSINQLKPGASSSDKSNFLITGTGDGGMIDLLRVTINNFNQGRIVQELFGQDHTQLIEKLLNIRKEWESEQRLERTTWLYTKYSELKDEGLLEILIARLKDRVRKDTNAILNGKEERLSQVLRLDKASLLNTLLVFTLNKFGAFRYLGGKCNVVDHNKAIIEGETIEVDRIIVRHGTERKKVLEQCDFQEAVDVLIKKDDIRSRIDTAEREYPPGWWGQYYSNNELLEFVPPPLLTIATSFISTLSDILKHQHKDAKASAFRITLHRIIKINEELYQQVSRYAGTRTGGSVGRVFNIKGGIVGLSCRLGKPVIVTKDENFDEIWDQLHLDDVNAREIDPVVKSLLACPFFAPTKDEKDPEYVSLVLFMDSGQIDFFTDNVLKIIYSACKGFVENIEEMRKSKEVIFSSTDYLGHKFTAPKTDMELVLKYQSVVTDNDVFKHYKKDLTFKTVTSFESDLNFYI